MRLNCNINNIKEMDFTSSMIRAPKIRVLRWYGHTNDWRRNNYWKMY
jgi:hypothetical protein